MDDLDRVRKSFVELWGRLGSFWGISGSAARVYAWMIARPGGATADEIMDGAGISRGAVSMACQELLDWGLLLREKVPGSRQITYSLETDLERIVRNVTLARKRREWDPILDNLSQWISELAGEKAEGAKVFQERLESIESLIAVVNSLAESFLKGGVVSRVGLKTLVAAAERKRRRKARS